MTHRFIYITTETREEALAIGRALVAERLAACANVLPEITSVFRWEGKVQEEAEVSLIAKTAADRVDALTARVKELHSYDCPCVISLPIDGGNPEFLQWIEAETKEG